MSMLLQVRALTAGYGDFQALHGIDLALPEGEVLAIIGANGAGKSTLLHTLAGAIALRSGSVEFAGQSVGNLPAHQVCAAGIALVPEGRRLFPSLSVQENLQMGAYVRRPGPWNLAAVYGLFPILHEFRGRPATELSGGQQQMVALGRALMSNPRLLLCDELSLGLAPVVVRDIYRALPSICAQGVSVIVVEQDISQALGVARHVVCMREGRVVLAGAPAELTREQIAQAYFGAAAQVLP